MKFWNVPKHIENLNGEVGELRDLYTKLSVKVAHLEADMRWVKWLVTGILGGVILLLIKAFLLS